MEIMIILGVIAIITIYVITAYNRLVALRNNREQSFADIDVQLKQRHDLIPQLVSAVKGYMKHEDRVLTQVTEARAGAMKAKTVNEKIVAEASLGAALGGFNLAVEAYPDLKASQNFMQLQTEISDIENKLAAARRFFNSTTTELNKSVQMFPSNIIANMFGFPKEPMFDLGTDKREQLDEAPKIDI